MTSRCWLATTPSPHPCLGSGFDCWSCLRRSTQRFGSACTEPRLVQAVIRQPRNPPRRPGMGELADAPPNALDGLNLKPLKGLCKADDSVGGGTSRPLPMTKPSVVPMPAKAT